MTIDDLLTDIGLSDKEAHMYITLLRSGNQSTSTLARRAEFNRGTAYVILHQLVEKGLATKSTKKKVQYFAPCEPDHLIDYLEHKKQEAESGKQKVAAMMAQLTAITNPLTAKPKIEFYDGIEGARTVLESTLKAKDKELIAFQSMIDLIDFIGPDFFEEVENKRIKQKRSVRAIRTKEKDKQAEKLDPLSRKYTSKKTGYREVRYAPEDLAFPMTMYLFDDKLAIISSKEEQFSVILQSKELASMQKKLFELLWQSLDVNTIKVGILHSLTGTMAISERSVVDAELMAIQEINDAGGILGKQVEPIVIDSKSDDATFAAEAKRLITEEGVCSVFGGWTSASRKSMLPVFEKYNHLLWYIIEYEGLEESDNCIYVGASCNQQTFPGIDWAAEHLGKRWYLVGSDYIFPRATNELIKERATELGCEVVGEGYEPLGSENFSSIIKEIQDLKPDVILNTINGDSNVSYMEQLRAAGIQPRDIPMISFSLSEEEIVRIGPQLCAGDYVSRNYFQCLKNKENKAFVGRFQDRYGKHRVLADGTATAYIAVKLFAVAAEKAKSTDPTTIHKAARGLTIDSPDGPIKIHQENNHAYRAARIGQIQKDGQIEILWTSKKPIQPDPYPDYRSKKEWQSFLDGWQKKWKGWAK